ncbi:MAG: thermonuclease family protein [Calothrix sp. CSU_2_0]|nr:thermonuclease family protein [Calothrix sp. CSU_2_0]
MNKIAIVTAIALLFTATPANAQTTTAKVISVGDGDTIRVEFSATKPANNPNTDILEISYAPTTVRLGCIDAPEIKQQPWGTKSRDRLKQLLPPGKSVQIREITRDRYGRMVAEVYLGKQSVNLQLVKEGAAVIYRQYFNGCAATAKQFEQAEAAAKKRKLGFWNQAKPVMPWDFRRGKTTPARQATSDGQCQCPYDRDRAGRQCGKRSAYNRVSGDRPVCYVED